VHLVMQDIADKLKRHEDYFDQKVYQIVYVKDGIASEAERESLKVVFPLPPE
jgi:hypothetical protein